MATHSVHIENRPAVGKGREARTQSIAIRFTKAEERALVNRAEATGKNLREWAREVLLRAESMERRCDMELHIFTELVGMQMLPHEHARTASLRRTNDARTGGSAVPACPGDQSYAGT